MISRIYNCLLQLNYSQIETNVPFIKLFVQFDISSAKIIQVIDCEEEFLLTQEQHLIACRNMKEYVWNQGYVDYEHLSIVVTDDIYEARQLAKEDNHLWIYNTDTKSLVIFENEPDEFFGIREKIESAQEDYGYGYFGAGYETNEPEVKAKPQYGTLYSSHSRLDYFLENLTFMNTAVVVINVAVFIWMSIIGSTEDVEFMVYHGTMFVPAIIEDKEIYRLLTCMFQHFGFSHLAGNMVILLFVGDNVERALGGIKYIILYLLAGITGSIGSFLYAYFYDQWIISAGASGAIFGIIGALLYIVAKNKGRLEDMTTMRVCILIVYALYNGFTSDNVDNAAHLFGLMGGFLLAVLLYRKPIEA